MTKFLSVIFFLSLALGARAHWKGQTLRTIALETARAQHLNSPGLATFWGGFRRFLPWTHNDGSLVPLSSHLFAHGPLKVYVSERPDRAPLFVFMPGIFGKPDGGLTPEIIDHLEAIGGHVLVVPNLLSAPYISAYPQYGADPIAVEVLVMEEALSFMQKRLGARLGKVHVIAESLGTSVASAWASHDRKHQRRLYDMTLLWPQLQLPVAMKNFDNIINQHRAAAKRCHSVQKLWIMVKDFVFNDYPGPVSVEDQECLGAIVMVDGFVKAAQESWRSYVEVSGRHTPKPQGFEGFFRSYRPELWTLLERKDERITLGHWMTQIRADKNFPVRIMTSQDDFLNFGLDWSAFKKDHHFTDEELIVFSWGGHSGPMGIPGFREILRETFSEED